MKNSIFKNIETRRSTRTFQEKEIPSLLVEEFQQLLSCPPQAPLGTPIKLILIDKMGVDLKKSHKIGTYGFIKGTNSFLAGSTPNHSKGIIDFGYLFEWAILEATDRNLATCWLGGTISRSDIGKAIKLDEGEIIPCASPVGFAKEKRGMVDSLVALMAKSSQRKSFDELFFHTENLGAYRQVLEMVRLAPSASNRQPWRIFYRSENKRFDFFMKRTPLYDKLTPVDLQLIDMGIAMCHFALSCQALSLKGKWEELPSTETSENNLEYVISWTEV